jgi:basic membrane protein A and related proteins
MFLAIITSFCEKSFILSAIIRQVRNNMPSRTLILGVVLAVIVIIVGAGIYVATQPKPISEKLKVAVLLPGSITDAGFNAAMYEASHEIQLEMNESVIIDVAEGLGQVGVEPTMRDYASRGYKILFCWTIQYQDPAIKVAPDFPDTYFIVTAAWNLTKRNVISYQWPLWESAYLAGMVAAGVSNSSKIGTVAGFNIPTTAAVPLALIEGAKKVNPNIESRLIFGGVWDDVGKGRESGEALISWGADVLFCRGDGLDLGVIQAASIHSAPGTNKTVYMIGDMADQHSLAPKTIITSNMWIGAPCVRNFINMYKNGTLQSNTDLTKPIRKYVWGVRYGQNNIAPFYGLDYKVPSNVKDMINRCRNAMMSGQFSVQPYANGTIYTTGSF